MELLKISKMSGKLEGIPAINANTLSNPFCQKQTKQKSSICSSCYSVKMLSTYRKRAVPVFEKNSELLESGDFVIPGTRPGPFRLHGHGELQSFAHLESFHRIVEGNPQTTFALWTKRVDLVRQYRREYTVPSNFILVYSNPSLERVLKSPPEGFDRVFNVVPKTSEEPQNCTGKKCKDCLLCYKKGGVSVIVEAIK